MSLEDESYFASMFFACNPSRDGKLRVSKLLDFALQMQDRTEDDEEEITERSQSLEVLKDILDPYDVDPLIDVDDFQTGCELFRKKDNRSDASKNVSDSDSNVSPIKSEPSMNNSRKSGNELHLSQSNAEIYTNVQPNWRSPITSSPFRNSLNSSGNSFSSYEGNGGESSIIDPIELQSENKELRFRIQKQLDEISDLKIQISQAEENNFQLLHQKEESDRKLLENKAKDEKIKSLKKELDELKTAYVSVEEKGSVVTKRIQRLEKDLNELTEENSKLRKEVKESQKEANINLILNNKCRDEESKNKENIIQELTRKFSEAVEKIDNLESSVIQLNSFNEALKYEVENYSSVLKKMEASQADTFENLDVMVESFEDDESISKFKSPYTTPFKTNFNSSIQAEVYASLSPLDQKRGSLFNFDASGNDVEIQCGILDEEKEKERCKIFQSLLKLFYNFQDLRNSYTDGTTKIIDSHDFDGSDDIGILDISSKIILTLEEPEDLVSKINEELYEFRKLLKSQSCDITQNQNQNNSQISPLPITENEIYNQKLIDASTQTVSLSDVKTSGQNNGESSDNLDGGCLDIDEEISSYMEKMSLVDDCGVKLETVLKVSEIETETSPSTMNPERGGSSPNSKRVRLIRMPNATEEDVRSDPDECKSEQGLSSAMISHPGSKRPLQVQVSKSGIESNNHENCDISESDTTFGFPNSSISSSTYMTPSNHESLTNFDENISVLNDDERYESMDDSQNFAPVFRESQTLRKRQSTFGPVLENDKRPTTGVIPESKKEQMIRYAYDPPARLSEDDARICTGKEWRTLRVNLDSQQIAEIRKQEVYGEFGENDDASVPVRPQTLDMDDESEKYWEAFPKLVENLFHYLDLFKEDNEPSVDDWNTISKRFEQLALVFKTNHISLPSRAELSSKEYENAQARLKDISHSLKTSLSSLQNFLEKNFDHRVSEDITEELMSIDHSFQELDRHIDTVSKTSQRAGMMEIEKRIYKMIEVMILYVHVQQNRLLNMDKDFTIAKNLLLKNRLINDFSKERSFGKHQNNNNDDETMSWSESPSGEGRGRERSSTSRLQPQTPPANPELNVRLIERAPNENILIRFVSEGYELARRELHWPWSWDQTWRGIKKGFSFILMICGIVVMFKTLFPSVLAQPARPGDCLPRCSSPFAELFYKVVGDNSNLKHDSPPEI